jgi:putative tryptophan/tyrosine transport system substrate-binding protein
MELVALAPDVIVAGSGGIAVELKRTSRTIPIVFPTANDPVGVGLVDSLERPGGNATGFSGFESGQTEKFLDLLKQIAPNVGRRFDIVRACYDPPIPTGGWLY